MAGLNIGYRWRMLAQDIHLVSLGVGVKIEEHAKDRENFSPGQPRSRPLVNRYTANITPAGIRSGCPSLNTAIHELVVLCHSFPRLLPEPEEQYGPDLDPLITRSTNRKASAISSAAPFGVAVYSKQEEMTGGSLKPKSFLVGGNTTLNAPAGDNFGPEITN